MNIRVENEVALTYEEMPPHQLSSAFYRSLNTGCDTSDTVHTPGATSYQIIKIAEQQTLAASALQLKEEEAAWKALTNTFYTRLAGRLGETI